MHAKCMFTCYIYSYKIKITAILIGFCECFASILRCFHLKNMLHGFVHFAWIFACVFTGTLFSKLTKGSPTSFLF